MSALLPHWASIPLWTQTLIVLLMILLLVFAGHILLSLLGNTLLLLRPQPAVSRRAGLWLVLGGIAGWALLVLAVYLQEQLADWLGSNTVIFSLGLAALSTYTLADGLGQLLWRRERVGVVALIWLMLAGIVWLICT